MDETLEEIARRQQGVFSRAQAIEHGHTGTMIWRRLANREWVEVERHVYRANAALRDGLATTSLARTIIDLSDVVPDDKLLMAFDSGQRKYRELPSWLEAELQPNAVGRKRDALMDMVRRARGEQPTDSPLEAKAALAMHRFGLPAPRRQHNVHDPAGKFIARVDFAWPEQRVILQCASAANSRATAGVWCT